MKQKDQDLTIVPVDVTEEIRRSYLDYAMSVIVARALPDVRDGLKPVHRRILYAMKENGFEPTKPYRKSARIVGDVMGKYHPHGDQAIYDAMVRMAQGFSMRVPLIDGHGNFGSMDGDSPAAMRYTEARMASIAERLTADLAKKTVDFLPNYDESLVEPSVLPAAFPNILVNGGSGIAVGMVTNIPPHNLGEVIDGTLAFLKNQEITSEELMEYIPGPDLPTGGIVMGARGIADAYSTGKGHFVMRAQVHTEDLSHKRHALVVTELPYQVNKARLVERIAGCVREKVVTGIGEVRDESDRRGVRLVIELKRDVAVPDVVLEQLYSHTALQTSFGVHLLALRDGQPISLGLREILHAFVSFRDSVVLRRAQHDYAKARERAHIVLGLLIAVAHIDPVIVMIKKSKDPATAKKALMERVWPAQHITPFIKLIDGREPEDTYHLTEAQAKAILDLRLHRLTGMEQAKLREEMGALSKDITALLHLISHQEARFDVIAEELSEIKAKYATPRLTQLEAALPNQTDEDLIPKEDMVVTVTSEGYIKRVPLSSYRMQRRGGRGRLGMATKEEDFVAQVLTVDTHCSLLFFSNAGRCYTTKTWRLPLGTPQSRGKAMVNIFPLQPGECVTAMTIVRSDAESEKTYIVFATDHGMVRRNKLADFLRVRSSGKQAMTLQKGESLIEVRTCCAEDSDVLLITRKGMVIRFPVEAVRAFAGRQSRGVRGIHLASTDRVVGMDILHHSKATYEERETYLAASTARRRIMHGGCDTVDLERSKILQKEPYVTMEQEDQLLLTVATNGLGQLASAYDYRITGRGGKGIRNISLARGAEVIGTYLVQQGHQVILVTSGGQLIRLRVQNMISKSRGTKGVRLVDLTSGDKVIGVSTTAFIDEEDDEEETVET